MSGNKRTRTRTCTSLGDMVQTAAPPPVKCLKPSPPEDEPPARVLTVSSPLKESRYDSGDYGGRIARFLDNCYYCKINIPPNEEVFMYSNLRAFCTAECRDRQMTYDKEKEKLGGANGKVMFPC